MLAAGDRAPDFTLANQDGEDVSLRDFAGGALVLYFYPRSDTPGCTTQACGVRDRSADYDEAGATVVGVSPDTVSAQRKFADKYSLDFPLLADADHEVAERYGVWVEKNMYGRKRMGIQRATFIIGPDGVIQGAIPKASPKSHDDDVLALLQGLPTA